MLHKWDKYTILSDYISWPRGFLLLKINRSSWKLRACNMAWGDYVANGNCLRLSGLYNWGFHFLLKAPTTFLATFCLYIYQATSQKKFRCGVVVTALLFFAHSGFRDRYSWVAATLLLAIDPLRLMGPYRALPRMGPLGNLITLWLDSIPSSCCFLPNVYSHVFPSCPSWAN